MHVHTNILKDMHTFFPSLILSFFFFFIFITHQRYGAGQCIGKAKNLHSVEIFFEHLILLVQQDVSSFDGPHSVRVQNSVLKQAKFCIVAPRLSGKSFGLYLGDDDCSG